MQSYSDQAHHFKTFPPQIRNHASPPPLPLHPAPEAPGFPRNHDPGGEGCDGAAPGLYPTALRPGKDCPGRCRDRRGHRHHRVEGGIGRRDAADL